MTKERRMTKPASRSQALCGLSYSGFVICHWTFLFWRLLFLALQHFQDEWAVLLGLKFRGPLLAFGVHAHFVGVALQFIDAARRLAFLGAFGVGDVDRFRFLADIHFESAFVGGHRSFHSELI